MSEWKKVLAGVPVYRTDDGGGWRGQRRRTDEVLNQMSDASSFS